MNSKSNKSPSPLGEGRGGAPIVLGKYSPSQNGVVVSPKKDPLPNPLP